ncbi:MAG: hypothetical protein COX81_02380 [Candidatus Magasanikbacteria bacterium CG_4_10_14_0_2_um_filter_37_12]|uniref:Type II secretion system protein GspG C-terminal domain-containing protein n=1 Tax=Candidatus Magasanikbacteria bacterium CG_4_10_14_0_2_um_filter_37_12 TaxID=1974637 RepID=A0A2M7V7W8_9BACT|nr:MAG: hypothetical protein COX81_02380 [Candidatus Magasanikbacteria bacterium CG_4_10_14_0_2_um_filter_37_12]
MNKKSISANRRGFTLIELLVVVAIIGLLSTLAVVALGSAREKARDSKRLSDVKQVQTALELYYTDNNLYPAPASAITLGSTNYACLNSGSGFTTAGCSDAYMGQVPADPLSAQSYTYTSADGSTYEITLTLEGAMGGFGGGAATATPSGITGQAL